MQFDFTALELLTVFLFALIVLAGIVTGTLYLLGRLVMYNNDLNGLGDYIRERIQLNNKMHEIHLNRIERYVKNTEEKYCYEWELFYLCEGEKYRTEFRSKMLKGEYDLMVQCTSGHLHPGKLIAREI